MNFQNIKLSTLSPGTYTIKAIFDGDDTYEAAETEFTLIIDANNEAHVVIPDSGSAEQGAKRHPSLAFAEATQTKTEVTSHKYQLQMPANPNMLDLVWSCNNSSVSIDATGKTITIPNAPATCTITASFSGNSLYYAATASYTLTIEEANNGSSTPTPTPTPSEEEEDDPRYYNIYFEEQMVAQQVNQSMVYTLQAPKTQETASGTLPSNIRDCCYFTLDDSPTHIPISSQIAISQEGMHILTLHFTGTSDYDPYNIAYTLTVGDIQNTIEKKSLNLRFSAASYSYDGTGEARYTFSYDTQYPITQSKFSINLIDLTSSSTNPRTSSYSYTEKYVVLDTTTLVEGHEYQISIKYDGDANYKVGTATTRVLYQQQEQGDYINQYFTIESLQDNNTISVNNYWGYNTNTGPENGLTLTLYWSKDKSNWTSVTISRTSSQGSSSNISSTITTLNKNEKIYIKGNAPTGGQAKADSPIAGKPYYMDYWNCFSSTQNINVKGNIMSLLYGDNFENQTALSGNFCFYGLFYNNENIIDASNLVLPSTTLVYGCYWRMFEYCTSLTTAPQLPATTLAKDCYFRMFDGCTSLTTAPALPATTLAENCYEYMFYHCTSLTTAPELPATTLVNRCYADMFVGCTSLTTAPALPATTLANYCYNYMFDSCKALTTTPELPATTLAQSCYYSMFIGCTSLTTAPVLPATTLAYECYNYMFSGCTSLTTIPSNMLPATTLADYCYDCMFERCTSLTSVPSNMLPATTLATRCYNGMFRGCTSLTTAPNLPATTLTYSCYNYMFYGCTSLNYIKALFTTTPTIYLRDYIEDWVENVASSGTFVKNSNATWNEIGTSGIPSGWTVQYASS